MIFATFKVPNPLGPRSRFLGYEITRRMRSVEEAEALAESKGMRLIHVRPL